MDFGHTARLNASRRELTEKLERFDDSLDQELAESLRSTLAEALGSLRLLFGDDDLSEHRRGR